MKYEATIKVNNLTINNRLVLPPMATGKAINGKVTPEILAYYNRKTQGGYLGLVIVEHAYISKQGIANQNQISISDDSDIVGLQQLVEVIHQNGTKVFAQINHAGYRSIIKPSYSASDIEDSRAMNLEQIKEVIRDFVLAGIRAKKAGFDGVEVHSAHSYLLNQFYSPLVNHRSDQYGCLSVETRVLLHREILTLMREALGNDYPLAIRLGGCDYQENGSTIEDCLQACKLLAPLVDLIDLTGGMNGYTIKGHNEAGYFAGMTKAVKSVIDKPIICTGGVTSINEVEQLLTEEVADLIGIGRAIYQNDSWAKDNGLVK